MGDALDSPDEDADDDEYDESEMPCTIVTVCVFRYLVHFIEWTTHVFRCKEDQLGQTLEALFLVFGKHFMPSDENGVQIRYCTA